MANKSSTRPFLKVLILGDSSVGKTSLMRRYVQGRFSELYRVSIGADFLTKELLIDDTMVYLQVWDTAGQERFESLGRAFYRGTDVCILVYDITNPRSLERLADWKRIYEESMPMRAEVEHTVFGVFANKADLEEQRKVPRAKAEAWCAENGDMPHFSVSAKEGENVEQAFHLLATQAKRKLDEWNHHQQLLIDDKISFGVDVEQPGPCMPC